MTRVSAPPTRPGDPSGRAGSADSTSVARNLQCLVEAGRLPQPGSGRTWDRFVALSEASRSSLSVGRLYEAHADGQSILLEAGWDRPDELGMLGVWASDARGPGLALREDASGWTVSGTKPFCSGAPIVEHALVTATDPAGEHRLCVVPLRRGGANVSPSQWVSAGMRDTMTRSVEFEGAPVVALVGEPGWYLHRAGFWHGAVAVAASWYGGAQGVLDTMRASVRSDDPHALAHLGEAESIGYCLGATLARAAHDIDDDPDDTDRSHRRALSVRGAVARGCLAIVEHAAGALGPRSMVADSEHAQRIADIDVYVRQDHGRRDCEQLGRLAAEGSVVPC